MAIHQTVCRIIGSVCRLWYETNLYSSTEQKFSFCKNYEYDHIRSVIIFAHTLDKSPTNKYKYVYAHL